MSLKLKYFLFIGLIHIVLGYLTYQMVKDEKIWFLVVEMGLLISLFLSYLLYKQLIAPLQLLASGATAIEDQDFQVKFLKTGSLEMDRLIGVYNNMIDNLRTERTHTKEQHYFMQQVLNTSPSAVLLLDFDNKIAFANPKAIKWFALNNYEGEALESQNHPLLRQLDKISLNSSQTIQIDGSKQYKVERSIFVDQGFNRQFLVIEDISEQILEAEKRAYEKVIRMMAHEVNNSIGAINSIIQTNIDYQEEMNDPLAEDLVSSLRVAKDRNDRLNRFMRNFADIIRLPLPKPEWVALHPLLQDTTQLMQPLANRQGTQIVLQLCDLDIRSNLDIKQLEQVLVNVIKNAIESIGENGIVQIITQSKPNQLIIRDNGQGISDEQAEKLFTPFYSNKAHGQGIGLTLSREILLNHGFEFSLRTGEDGWTAFTIHL